MRYLLTAIGLSSVIAIGSIACADLGGLAGDGELGPVKNDPKGKDGGGSEIPTEGGAIVDEDSGTPGGARCDLGKAFGAPELVDQFDTTSSFVKDAVLSSDELEALYLRYLGTGTWELRQSRRSSKSDAFGAPTSASVTPAPDGVLSLTASDKKLYFWTINADYRTTRVTTSAAFTMPTSFFAPNTPQAFFVASDDAAYYAVYDSDGGSSNKVIMRAGNSGTGLSSQVAEVPNIHLPNVLDGRPVLNASQTSMYFTSNRPGGLGLDDVWVARRGSKSDQFNAPKHVAELSTPDPDAVSWVSDDDCVVLLNRASHVYVARRPQ